MIRWATSGVGEGNVHDGDGVIVKDGRDIFRWELVCGVADKKARLSDGTVTDDHASASWRLAGGSYWKAMSAATTRSSRVQPERHQAQWPATMLPREGCFKPGGCERVTATSPPLGAPPREQGEVGRADELDGSEHHFQSTNIPCWERSVASVLEVAVGYVVGRGKLWSRKG